MAKNAKTQEKAKKQPEKQPVKQKGNQPEILLVRAPAEYVFWCHDGNIFADLRELAAGLEMMSDETFTYHCNSDKQDFSNWVRDIIEDEWLADELAMAASRLQAAEFVAARIASPIC